MTGATAILPQGEELTLDEDRLEAWGEELSQIGQRVFRPAPHTPMSQWADEHGRLSDGNPWRTSVVPYLREVMDAVTDRSVREVVVMKSARVGYTEGIVGQRVGYCIHQDPERILVVQPTEGDAKDWSQKQLKPMIQHSEVLREIVPEARGRLSGNTILDKVFDGGSITIRGAHSPKGLRRHTARDVILDEVDGFEVTSGDEGDPVMLSQRANRTLPDRKTLMGSTPKRKDTSRIWKALQASDFREYHVACPSCNGYQVLKWGGPGVDYGIKWAKEVFCQGCGTQADEDAESCTACKGSTFDTTHLHHTAYYQCEHCGHHIQSHDKTDLLASGESGEEGAGWIPRYPGREVRGYHISGLLSPFEGASWANMVFQFLLAKDDPALLQVWTNQWLGEPWEDQGKKVELTGLATRGEEIVNPEGDVVDISTGVGILTAAVDVHETWLEVLVVGWGHELESWDVFHERIPGDPELDATWARLDPILTRAWRHERGRTMRIACTMVDAGYATEKVYSWVRPREGRNVFAILGDRSGDEDHPPLKKPSKSNSEGVKVWTAGTFKLKEALFRRLAIESPGPRYHHFRVHNPERCNGFDGEYFAQFEAEKRVDRQVKGSRTIRRRWVKVRPRNEAIDLHVYNHAALLALGAGVRYHLAKYALQAARPPDPDEDQGDGGSSRRRPRNPRGAGPGSRGRGGWVRGY